MIATPIIPPPTPPNPILAYNCDVYVLSANGVLDAMVYSLTLQDLYGLKGCCENWSEAFQLFAAINTYNELVNLSDSNSNATKICVCNFLKKHFKPFIK